MINTSTTGNMSLDNQTGISGGPETARTGRFTGRFIARFSRQWWQAYCCWDDRLRQRRRLGALDDHLLADIGVNQMQARREASRWFFM